MGTIEVLVIMCYINNFMATKHEGQALYGNTIGAFFEPSPFSFLLPTSTKSLRSAPADVPVEYLELCLSNDY